MPDWKASLLANVPHSARPMRRVACFVDLTRSELAELAELRLTLSTRRPEAISYWEYFKALRPLSLASGTWMTGASRYAPGVCRSGPMRERAQRDPRPGDDSRIAGAIGGASRRRLRSSPAPAHPRVAVGRPSSSSARTRPPSCTSLWRRYVHPSMQYKLLARFAGRFVVDPRVRVGHELAPTPAPVISVRVRPPVGTMRRFDIEVEGSHNYLADGDHRAQLPRDHHGRSGTEVLLPRCAWTSVGSRR